MVNRDNWKLVKRYLSYRQFRVSRGTVSADRSALKHLLEWLDSTSVFNAAGHALPLPAFLAGAGLCKKSQARVGGSAAGFFNWLRAVEPKRSARLGALFIESLTPRNGNLSDFVIKPYSIDDIRRLCAVAGGGLVQQRTQGAVALMFLSGMRPGALVTLPINCLDLDAGEVRQWTSAGVKTKFSKSATTFLLDLPDLLDVVRQWDAVVRSALPGDNAWYAHIYNDGRLKGGAPNGTHRMVGLGKLLYKLCDAAGVERRRLHDIRHGHATYAIEHCQDMADYKAVSLNLMHESITTTDRVYVNFQAADVKARIASLGKAQDVS